MATPVVFDITPEKEASKVQFLRRQFSQPPPALSRDDVDLAGKSAVVTGATGGLGLECCLQLLGLGLSRLIIAVRDEAKGETVMSQLRATIDPSTQAVEIWALDYATYESISSFVDRIQALTYHVDIVILNAGIFRRPFTVNPSTGHEEHLQTNYLSTILIVLHFLRIWKTAQEDADFRGRIVLVSSDTAAWSPFREGKGNSIFHAFDDRASTTTCFERYGTSKLLCQIFVAYLCKIVPCSLATINCANPGLCHGSSLFNELPLMGLFTWAIGQPPSVGARAVIYAAVVQDEISHGQYVEQGKVRPMAPLIYSKQGEGAMKRLWEETMEELSFAGAQRVVDCLCQP